MGWNMRCWKKLDILVLLIFLFALFPGKASAQSVTPTSIRIAYTETTESDKALNLGVYFTLYDEKSGAPALDARIKSVELTQLDTNTVTPAAYKKADTPFYIVLLMDSSGSMQPAAKDLRAAASSSISDAPPGAQFAVAQFDKTVTLLHDFSSDPDTITRAISMVNPKAGAPTCLYDALYSSLDQLKQTPQGRRAIILFTDGRDEINSGQPCSRHSLNDVINYALQPDMHVPINAIGMSGANSDINANELSNLASNTGGFSAVGSQGNLGNMFTQIMQSLGSQWLAQAELYPLKGKHDAALRVTLDDGTVLSTTLNYTASRDFAAPPPAVAVTIDSLEAKADGKGYTLHLSIVSPQLIDHLRVSVWDGDAGVEVSEKIYKNLTSPATFDIPTDGMVNGKTYEIHVEPFAADNTPITDPSGKPISLTHELKYDANLKATKVSIASVAVDGAALVATLDLQNGDQVQAYSGWLVNEDTNAEVNGSEFTTAGLEAGDQLRISMGKIPAGKYKIELKALGQGGASLAQAEYEGVVYTPPAAPSALSVLFSKIGAGLKANPWILIAAILVLLGAIGVVAFITIRRRETATPMLQGSLEVVLGQPNAAPPVSQTVILNKPIAARPAPAARPDQPLAMLRVMLSPDPAAHGNTFMVDHTPFVIGRKDADLNFGADAKISRRHAQITFDPGTRRYIITDLGSSNGLFLNGTRIAPNTATWLASGTKVQLGPDTHMIFEQR